MAGTIDITDPKENTDENNQNNLGDTIEMMNKVEYLINNLDLVSAVLLFITNTSYVYVYVYIYISDAIGPYYQCIGIVSVRNSLVSVRVQVRNFIIIEYQQSLLRYTVNHYMSHFFCHGSMIY